MSCIPPLGINNRCRPVWRTSARIVELLFRQRVPGLREDFYQSGSYRIGAAGDVSDVLLFVKLLLEDYPDIDGIEVRRVRRMFVELNVVLLKPFGDNRCSMDWSIILLKNRFADGVVYALHDGRDRVLQRFETPLLAFTDFTTKGQKVPRFPPKTAPDHHGNSFAPFLSAMHSFPLFRRCSKYPDLMCII